MMSPSAWQSGWSALTHAFRSTFNCPSIPPSYHSITLHPPSRSVREWFAQTNNSAEESVKPTQHTPSAPHSSSPPGSVVLTNGSLCSSFKQSWCANETPDEAQGPLQLTADWTAESSPAHTHMESPSVSVHTGWPVCGLFGVHMLCTPCIHAVVVDSSGRAGWVMPPLKAGWRGS